MSDIVSKPDCWIVGKHVGDYSTEEQVARAWEFQGVFDDEAKAEKACIADAYFYAPAVMNSMISDETREWYGTVYHRLREAARN